MTEFSRDESSSDHNRFVRATGLVSAAADLMARLLPYAPEQAPLDNATLATLAERIYQEALVAEAIYIQLEERFHALRPAGCDLFGEPPQVCLPLWFLSEEQLEQVRTQADYRAEQLESAGKAVSGQQHALLAAIRTELEARAANPHRPQPAEPE
ncbi:hypothetical protein Q4485_16665 [Granulosicoccaceae sp. 1_MG-2023]|nr:hypothetical protein [Granulosicoccaceae sp. 1_MG-2023]